MQFSGSQKLNLGSVSLQGSTNYMLGQFFSLSVMTRDLKWRHMHVFKGEKLLQKSSQTQMAEDQRRAKPSEQQTLHFVIYRPWEPVHICQTKIILYVVRSKTERDIMIGVIPNRQILFHQCVLRYSSVDGRSGVIVVKPRSTNTNCYTWHCKVSRLPVTPRFSQPPGLSKVPALTLSWKVFGNRSHISWPKAR